MSEGLKIINCLGLKLEKILMILLNLDSESFRDTRQRNVTKSFCGLIVILFAWDTISERWSGWINFTKVNNYKEKETLFLSNFAQIIFSESDHLSSDLVDFSGLSKFSRFGDKSTFPAMEGQQTRTTMFGQSGSALLWQALVDLEHSPLFFELDRCLCVRSNFTSSELNVQLVFYITLTTYTLAKTYSVY